MAATKNDRLHYAADCPICNSDDVGVINQMLLSNMKYKNIMEAYRGRVKMTRHILRVHKREHLDTGLRAKLIDSIEKGELQVHNTAEELYELIKEAKETYYVCKDKMIRNIDDPDYTLKVVRVMKLLISAQKDLLKFNADLLKEAEDLNVGTIDLTQIAQQIDKVKKGNE